jgi:GNAT superfamily N-acetyltransferase
MTLNPFSAEVAAERRRDLMTAADTHRLRAQARRNNPPKANRMRIRIRQVTPPDAQVVASVFSGLGSESMLARFLSPVASLGPRAVSSIVDGDPGRREALIALTRWRRRGIGIAELIRDVDDPTVAEVAAAVSDEWQGRGVGTMLARSLAARGRRAGITAFTAITAQGNIRARRRPGRRARRCHDQVSGHHARG